jgi:ATP-dependent exoDNAse (exonuclease V) beta subunit
MEILNKVPTTSFSIYDASAGSGKTYTLVKEYLKIILSSKKNDAYRNILAITFTNKAVHEMKSRIVTNLHEFSKIQPSKKSLDLLNEISRETELSPEQIITKAHQIIRHLIHNYAAFDILTIDKFTHKVIRAFAHELNLPITFEVTLDTDLLLQEAVDAIIAKAGDDKTLTNLLLDFTIEKADEDKSWDITREVFEISKLIYSENNREQIGLLKNKTMPEFIDARHQIASVKSTLESSNKELGKAAIEMLKVNNIDLKSFSRGTFPNHLVAVSQGAYKNANKKFRLLEEVQINKNAQNKQDIERLIPQILSQLQEVYSNFDRIDFLNAFLKNITPLSLLNTVVNELSQIQKDQNLLSIAEFNALIYDEIQNQPAPFIYERLGEKYRHFFIDEFQDTSEMQWKNLIPLIDNALSSEFQTGERGTLMIVGDPKQSIYRWRGGKAEQFIELSKNVNPFHNITKELFHLEKNYRSYSQIINFNNDFFRFLSKEFNDLDYRDLYENHSFQLSNSNVGGFVNLSFLNSNIELDLNFGDDDDDGQDKNNLYCVFTFNKIEELLAKGFDYKDIAILTRKRDQGVLIANYLTKKNIPLISPETLLIQNSTEVQFIINMLRYLNHQDDIEAKAFCLLYLATNNQTGYEVHDFISAGMNLSKESDFEQWLLTFDITITFNNIRKKSLYESVEQVINIFLNNNCSNSYLQYFQDIILERDYNKQAGISDFLVFWESNSSKFSIPSPEGNNAIRIMTIHKSKGLEFPVVIVPFAEEDYDKKPKDKIWIDTENSEFGFSKVLVDNTKAVASFGDEASLTYSKIKQQESLDNINLLYVALTRAEEQLYIISSLIKVKNDGQYPNNMSSFFIKFLKEMKVYEDNKLQYSFGLGDRLSKSESLLRKNKEIIQVKVKFDKNKIKIAQKESLLWGTYQQSAIEYGNIIHEILSKIITSKDVGFAITEAEEIGLINFAQKEMFFTAIHEIINHDSLSIYFSDSNKVFNEQVIIQKEQSTVKPDRIVVTKDNETLLLDYKTGKYEEKHRKQLENYESVLKKMNFNVTRKTLVYIGENLELVHL